MAIHLLGTAWHAVKAAGHASSGEEKKANAEILKMAASIIPGGGVVTSLAMGGIIDAAVVEGKSGLAYQMGRNAWDNRDSLSDMDDAVSELGNNVLDSLQDIF